MKKFVMVYLALCLATGASCKGNNGLRQQDGDETGRKTTHETNNTPPVEMQRKNVEFTNTIGMEFVKVPAGNFMMGAKEVKAEPFSNKKPGGNDDEKPAHEVTISQDFFIGKYEVTQAQWYALMGNNPSRYKSEDVGSDSRNHQVENVRWEDVQLFIQKLKPTLRF